MNSRYATEKKGIGMQINDAAWQQLTQCVIKDRRHGQRIQMCSQCAQPSVGYITSDRLMFRMYLPIECSLATLSWISTLWYCLKLSLIHKGCVCYHIGT
jgi:hypothetical protein